MLVKARKSFAKPFFTAMLAYMEAKKWGNFFKILGHSLLLGRDTFLMRPPRTCIE
jgi:hypothetical protein